MGVAQFPWFLTKMIVPIYSGWFLMNYCPGETTWRTPCTLVTRDHLLPATRRNEQ